MADSPTNPNSPGAGVPLEIDCDTVRAKLNATADFVLIDCREGDEFAVANIAGARLLPMSELQARIAELESLHDAEIAVHCHHGGRSLRVVKWLREQGFSKSQSMAGGIDAWSQHIDPTVPRY